MMGLLIDPRFRRRTLFAFGNLAVLIALVCVLIVPIYELFAERDIRIEQQGKRLARLAAVAGEAGRIEAIASQAQAQMQTGEFLSGANENVVSAELQTKLKGMTEAVGARSRALQALQVKTMDQVKFVGARIEIFGPIASIARAAYTIETAKPYLFISAASLKLASGSRPGNTEEPVIQAQFDVFGCVQTGGQP